MIKTIINTLIDSFCCTMLVSFCSFGLALAVTPWFTWHSAWMSLFSLPFFFVGFLCLMILDRRG